MDTQSVGRWFASYLADFVAAGRGDTQDVHRLVARYRLPLLLSTDSGCTIVEDEEALLALTRQQVDALQATGYDRSRELAAETVVLNRSCATHRALLSRVRADGSEISRLEVTYLLTDAADGHRITALVVHSPP